jgi:hypothetical protein
VPTPKCCGLSDTVSNSINSLASKTSENTEEENEDPEPAYDGDNQIKYSSDYFYGPSVRAITKNCLEGALNDNPQYLYVRLMGVCYILSTRLMIV